MILNRSMFLCHVWTAVIVLEGSMHAIEEKGTHQSFLAANLMSNINHCTFERCLWVQ